MRPRLAAILAVLPLALASCQEDEPRSLPASTPPTASSTASAQSSSPTGPQSTGSAEPKPVGPRTNCGEVEAANGDLVAVGVLSGRTTCATVLAVFRAYYRPDTPKQGSAGVATVDGWRCASSSAAETGRSGRASSCVKGSTRITADVIP